MQKKKRSDITVKSRAEQGIDTYRLGSTNSDESTTTPLNSLHRHPE